MDMAGKIKVLIPGSSPVPLADGKTILFEDQDARTWHLCDLDGGNVRRCGDGLKGYGFPAPAPDGQRVIMMKFNGNKGPRPILLNLGESEGKPITDAPGLWTTPVWR
jgi:Tol biopolymer transport system component